MYEVIWGFSYVSCATLSIASASDSNEPHRCEGYIASNDPDFETKAPDIIGLYLHTRRSMPQCFV
jgi:hypothetical protein